MIRHHLKVQSKDEITGNRAERLAMKKENIYIPALVSVSIAKQNKKGFRLETFLLRSQGSNLGPSGYEPDELPLLYFAMWGANIGRQAILAKHFY